MGKILEQLEAAPESLLLTWVLAMEVAGMQREGAATWEEIKAKAVQVEKSQANQFRTKVFSSTKILQVLDDAEAVASREVPLCF